VDASHRSEGSARDAVREACERRERRAPLGLGQRVHEERGRRDVEGLGRVVAVVAQEVADAEAEVRLRS